MIHTINIKTKNNSLVMSTRYRVSSFCVCFLNVEKQSHLKCCIRTRPVSKLYEISWSWRHINKNWLHDLWTWEVPQRKALSWKAGGWFWGDSSMSLGRPSHKAWRPLGMLSRRMLATIPPSSMSVSSWYWYLGEHMCSLSSEMPVDALNFASFFEFSRLS